MLYGGAVHVNWKWGLFGVICMTMIPYLNRLSLFTLMETIWPKILQKPLSKDAKKTGKGFGIISTASWLFSSLITSSIKTSVRTLQECRVSTDDYMINGNKLKQWAWFTAVIGFSCCGVPAQIFKLLLVYCYVLITSVCISSVFFFSVFFRAKLIK